MEPEWADRRREPRYPIQAGAAVEVNSNGNGYGRSIRATTVDMSGCGVLLQFEEPAQLAVGDRVICEFQLPQEAGKPLPYWGVGSIVRVECLRVAVDIEGGGWSLPDSKSGAR